MLTRSLNSSVFKWPDVGTVHRAVSAWAQDVVRKRPDVLWIGYIGSYARGDWGVGSDIDIVIILDQSTQPHWQRGLEFDASVLPVPADLLVYTRDEWQDMIAQGGQFCRTVEREAVWLHGSLPTETITQQRGRG